MASEADEEVWAIHCDRLEAENRELRALLREGVDLVYKVVDLPDGMSLAWVGKVSDVVRRETGPTGGKED